MSTSDTTADEDLTLEALHEQMEEMSGQLEAVAEERAAEPKMIIVAVHGSLDMAYPTLILSGLAGKMGWDVTVFATFWALDMLHEEKSRDLQLSALGNPGLPMPNALAVLPGGDRLATYMMRRKMDDNDVESVRDLIDRALDAGVDFQACQMTAELMEYDEDDFIEGVTTGAGAAGALMDMADADVQMVV